MNEDLIKKIDEQGAKIDAIYRSVEKTRKYFLVVFWVSVVCFVVPLIALFFVISTFISSYSDAFKGLL